MNGLSFSCYLYRCSNKTERKEYNIVEKQKSSEKLYFFFDFLFFSYFFFAKQRENGTLYMMAWYKFGVWYIWNVSKYQIVIHNFYYSEIAFLPFDCGNDVSNGICGSSIIIYENKIPSEHS
jgi:hypothetical protein